jgi:hypothetical protein
VGASVGDSSAWLISPAGEVTDLTAQQRRRPLLGSGEALPVQFEAELGAKKSIKPAANLENAIVALLRECVELITGEGHRAAFI